MSSSSVIGNEVIHLHHETSGAGEGHRVVMLHEIGGALQTWSHVAAALDSRFRTLRYDQRGAGSSDPIRGDFSLDLAVDDLRVLLDRLRISNCHLIGGAMGCALAVRFAARWPERVRSLVLANPALSVSPDRKEYLAARAAKVEAEGMQATVEDTLAKSYPPQFREGPEFASYRERFLANDPASYAAINRAFAAFDAAPDLSQLTCPTLVLGGLHDNLRRPDEVRGVAEKILGARLEFIDAGHVMPVQAPTAMIAALRRFYDAVDPVPEKIG